jgi:hypothetical protein
MQLEHPATTASAIDVLDHVVDKGIVVDSRIVSIALLGIDLITIEGRIVVTVKTRS